MSISANIICFLDTSGKFQIWYHIFVYYFVPARTNNEFGLLHLVLHNICTVIIAITTVLHSGSAKSVILQIMMFYQDYSFYFCRLSLSRILLTGFGNQLVLFLEKYPLTPLSSYLTISFMA